MIAAIWYGSPAKKMRIVGITGTSGKSSTVEILYQLLHSKETPCGALSSIQIHVGEKTLPNVSLRTTFRPWLTQKLLRQMYKAGCTQVVIEVSSHALDQNRLWGIPFDTAILTNIFDNEHLDYHENFKDYVETKKKLFTQINRSTRKGSVPKTIIVNAEAEYAEDFLKCAADKSVTFSRPNNADFEVADIGYLAQGSQLVIKEQDERYPIETPLLGALNAENTLAAIAAARTHDVSIKDITKRLKAMPSIPGRLESIQEGQPFTVLVDHSYKPSALEAVLTTLKKLTKGRVIIVWGGAGGRAQTNWEASARIIDDLADEFILTTDDPYEEDPKEIARIIGEQLTKKKEGSGLFKIDDRFEAIRYALFSAQPEDIILIAGRGIEVTQTIGKKKITFDDREISREILRSISTWELPNA